LNVLGLIPARGGSKDPPNKNLAIVAGKPLVQWTIECAKQSALLDQLVLSTDDNAIAAVGRQLGVEVVRRPDRLATDEATTLDVVRWHLEGSYGPHAVMVLQPTCPLRQPADIDGAIELMERTGCDSVVSYVDVGANHPARMAIVDGNGSMMLLDDLDRPEQARKAQFARRQDLVAVSIRSGDIYLTRRAVLEAGSLVGDDCRAWVIPPERHCNIDCARDLKWAEFLMRGGA
jgi:CMP-N-acetylneuraminic acid synthetase